jgi:hypothetical protein
MENRRHAAVNDSIDFVLALNGHSDSHRQYSAIPANRDRPRVSQAVS